MLCCNINSYICSAMKHRTIIKIIMLGVMSIISSIVFSQSQKDSMILQQVFNYSNHIGVSVNHVSSQVYLKYNFHTVRKNPILMFVPTMCVLANGRRNYVGEGYSKFSKLSPNNYEVTPQVRYNTFSSSYKDMPILLEYLTPDLYDVSILKGRLLSPFHRYNHLYYKYKINNIKGGKAKIDFRPRIKNTQLVNGWAYVDTNTGRIISTFINGEYDMVKFQLNIEQGQSGYKSLLPKKCEMVSQFSFLGNKINASYEADYDCPGVLSDTMVNKVSEDLISKLRVGTLTNEEKKEYCEYDSIVHASLDTIGNRKEISTWMLGLGNDLINSYNTNIGNASICLSPLFNPFYMEYSQSKGLAYKFDTKVQYNFNEKRSISLNVSFGYNFKIRQFYYTIPLQFNYNKRRDGYIRITYGNGNRISNASVYEDVKQNNDTIDYTKIDLNRFNDTRIELINHINLFRWLGLSTGYVFHTRHAVDERSFELAKRPFIYRSFAPTVQLDIRPWHVGPLFTFNYERGIKGISKSDVNYEKFELDGVYKFKLMRLRTLSFRAGGGFYTDKGSDIFVDYNNFRDNNLPENWNDDWSGQFQLLNDIWYNSSKYYIRSNFSYESPMLFLTWTPILGKYIEMERLYVSTLWVDRLHPYTEIGYGFTNRLFSFAIFTNALNEKVKEVGCKFTFELFNKW